MAASGRQIDLMLQFNCKGTMICLALRGIVSGGTIIIFVDLTGMVWFNDGILTVATFVL